MKINEIYSAYMYSYPHKTAYGELAGVRFSDYKRLLSDSGCSLYFHVPFCASKCGYCNLFSVTGQNGDYMERYISACETQLRQYGVPRNCFRSMIIGGGDPLILPHRLLHRVLSFSGPGMNICVETSPNETAPEKLNVLKKFHANRISIGVQSFLDSELTTLKRFHSAESAKKALDLLKSYGFPCVNIDLIYGIPGQTAASFECSLRHALSFAPDEIFIYPLYIRGGTKLTGAVINENTYEMYESARDFLFASGYFQASMRLFVKKAPIPKSCGFENMLAIGCGGRSYIGSLHFCHPYAVGKHACLRIIDNFIQAGDKTEIRNGFILDEDEMKRRFIIKNLLYFRGVSVSDYSQLFSTPLLSDFPVIDRLILLGYAEIKGDFVRLTPLGLSYSDYIGPMFISGKVNEKMATWKTS